MRNLRNNKGFTLIELMIVVVIIGILAAIAIPKFNAVSKSAKQAEAGPILKQLCTLGATYLDQKGTPAATAADLTAVGWAAPTAKYFTSFTYAGDATGGGTAAAVPGPQVVAASLDCATNVLTP